MISTITTRNIILECICTQANIHLSRAAFHIFLGSKLSLTAATPPPRPLHQRPALFFFFFFFSFPRTVQLQRINQMAVTKFTGERIGTE